MSEKCPHCDREYADKTRLFNHIYQSHGKTKARKYKAESMRDDVSRDTEAEYIIQGMIGER